jgi:hypothetical protein
MAEKHVTSSVESKGSSSDEEEFTWTEEEEKALVRRYADSESPNSWHASYNGLRGIMRPIADWLDKRWILGSISW